MRVVAKEWLGTINLPDSTGGSTSGSMLAAGALMWRRTPMVVETRD